MKNNFSTLLRNQPDHMVPVILYQNGLFQELKKVIAIINPAMLPLFIHPKAKIDEHGIVRNLHEFKTLNEIFDFSRCLECQALQEEYYGSARETPCMRCQLLVREIKEKNLMRDHLLQEFRSTSLH